MNANPQLLTDKEKQALRLLTCGHDAKSIARHLDLSVHTINERLRDARRKMGVSSSREAARLLRDFEAATPQNPVPQALRDAPPAPAAPVSARQPHHAGWRNGAVIMSFAIPLLVVAALAAEAPSSAPAPTEAAAQRPEVQAARDWLALLDADNWDAT